MDVCQIVLSLGSYGFFLTLFGSIIYIYLQNITFLNNLRKKEINLPNFYMIKMIFYLGMNTPPLWLKNKDLIEQYKFITIKVRFVIFGLMLFWMIIGVLHVKLCRN